MKKTLFTVISVALLLLPSLSRAQVYEPLEKDFRGRISVGVEKEVVRNFDISLESEFRVQDKFKSVDRFHTTLGLSYKICPYVKVGAGYTLMNLHRYDENASSYVWTMRHRAYADVTGMYKLHSGWKFSVRERFQYTYRVGDMNEYQNPRNAMVLRTRFKVSYQSPRKPLEPYCCVELRNTLNGVSYSSPNYVNEVGDNVAYNDVYLNRVRFQPGLEWRLAKNHYLDFYILEDYCYDKKFDANEKGKLKYFKVDGLVQYDSNGNPIYALYYQKALNFSVGISYRFCF